MNDTEYLISHGWRWIGGQSNGYGFTKYWDHPNHQPSRRGAFTQSKAIQHQRFLDAKNFCSCVPREPER